jgi:predicted RNase H-like nuclease (RuvC/YqgF family)
MCRNRNCENFNAESDKHDYCVKCIKMANEVMSYEKEITHLKGRIEQLEKEKEKLYDRCLENEEAMYDAVINGNDNHLIELVEKGV